MVYPLGMTKDEYEEFVSESVYKAKGRGHSGYFFSMKRMVFHECFNPEYSYGEEFVDYKCFGKVFMLSDSEYYKVGVSFASEPLSLVS